jgi:hypothetical protein
VGRELSVKFDLADACRKLGLEPLADMIVGQLRHRAT